MSSFLFLAAFAALPFIGFPFLRVSRTVPPSRAACVATSAAWGGVAICAEMLLLTFLRVRWTLPLLLAAPAVCVAVGRRRRAGPPAPKAENGAPSLFACCAAALVLVAVTYAAGTARATSADLMLFWASKGQKFAQARAIDIAFLGAPEHRLMHTDYPPLLPCLYAFATMIAGRFAWGASLLTLPIFLGIAGLAFFGLARSSLGGRVAGELTVVLLALCGFVLVVTGCAGNADPPLVAFEVLALSALVFARDRGYGLAAMGIALSAAVLTKVEGTVFAALVLGVALVLAGRGARRRVLRTAGVPPALALLAWVVFTRAHGLADVYGFQSGSRLSFAHLPLVLKETGRSAAYGAWYAPWIAVAALLIGCRSGARSLAPLAVGFGFTGFILYLYLSAAADPTLFIVWSASRLLVTPLICFFVAAAASTSRASPTMGGGASFRKPEGLGT